MPVAHLDHATDRRALSWWSVAAVAVVLLLPAVGRADNTDQRDGADKRLMSARTTTPPVIDGRLDEAVWASAPADDSFTQQLPDEAQAPSQRTQIRVLYDDAALYVAVRAFDAQPDAIVARRSRRDRQIETDWVSISVDPRHDHNTGMTFRVTAAGVVIDTFDYDDVRDSQDWDGVWQGAAHRDGQGWSAEMRLPLTMFRFPAPASAEAEQIWGVQVKRYISRRKETIQWVYVPTTVRGFVSRFGHLHGLRGLRPRRTLELRPFVVGRLTGETKIGRSVLGNLDSEHSHASGDVGLDGKIGLGSDLTVDATLLPDFGQVEADQVVLNLTRFESFFPEKRPFFLEGAEIFSTPIQMFYSRRIGRTVAGVGDGASVDDGSGRTVTVVHGPTQVPIWAAAKLTGRPTPRLVTGLLAAITGPEEATVTLAEKGPWTRSLRLAPPHLAAIGRGQILLGGASYVGVLSTAALRLGPDTYRADADHDALAQAIDGQWQSADGRSRWTTMAAISQRVGGPQRATRDGRPCPEGAAVADCVPIARSDGTVVGGRGLGFGATTAYALVGDNVLGDARYQVQSPVFDVNDLGFLTDFNKHQFYVSPGLRSTRPRGPFRNATFRYEASAGVDFDGVPLYARNNVNGNVTFKNFWTGRLSLGFSYPVQWDTNETRDGARFQRPNGAIVSANVGTDSRRGFVLSMGATSFRDSYAGAHGTSADLSLVFQGVPALEVALAPTAGFTDDQFRFYGCSDPAGRACTAESTERTYDFARLNPAFLSTTLRITYAFTSTLTLQGYGQLFASRGRWADYRTVSTTGQVHPWIHIADLAPSSRTGDSDGDGRKDDDFQSSSLNVNAVLRWEVQPGSTLMLVYTRSQSAAPPTDGDRPALRLRGLATGATDDVLLLKLTWFYS